MGFTKLDEGILRSSIMAEDSDTFKVWIALLAACRQDGIADVSPIFLASVCHMDIDTVQRALKKLEMPDQNSRSMNDEGRRIRRVDGGYEIINYSKYREKSYNEVGAEKMRQKREREKKESYNMLEHVRTCYNSYASASASEYDKKDKKEESREGKEEREGLERAIIDEFNRITGQRRQLTSETRRLLGKLINKGYEFNDFRRVIEFKTWDFSQKEELRKYIRPATFFAEARFEDYLEQDRIWRERRKNRAGEAGRDERQMSKEDWLRWRQTVEREIRRSLGQAGLSKDEIEEKVKEGLSEWERKNKYTGGNEDVNR